MENALFECVHMNCSIGSRLRAFCIRGVCAGAVPVVQRAGGLGLNMVIGVGTTAFVDIWEPTQILQDPPINHLTTFVGDFGTLIGRNMARTLH